MKTAVNIIRVRDIDKGGSGVPEGLPAKATIYKDHCLRKYPRLIYTVPGVGLVLDLDEWAAIIEAAKKESVERAERVQRELGER